MGAPKTTLSLIEDLVAYRDRLSDRADRDMLADVANELSRLNAQRAELSGLLAELHAIVVGECPSLLNEDSGGNSCLALQIEAAIAKAEVR